MNNAEPILSIVIISTSKGQKFEDVKLCIEDAIKKTCIGCIIKLVIKAKNAKKVLLNF